MASRFDSEHWSERARRALSLAQEEAQRFNHSYIGTEHVLLGLVRETDGVAARVLGNLGVKPNKVRAAVEFIIGKGDRPVSSENIGLTPRAKNVIELAVDEARELNHYYIGTEHLLIGVMREGEGVAVEVLKGLGVTLDTVRAEVIRILSADTGIRVSVSPSQLRERGEEVLEQVLLDLVGVSILRALRKGVIDGLGLGDLQNSTEGLIKGDGILNALRNVLDLLVDFRLIQEVQEPPGQSQQAQPQPRYRLTGLGISVLQEFEELCERLGRMVPPPPSTL